MPIYDCKPVKCPLCGSTEIKELGAGNDEAGYACDACRFRIVLFLDSHGVIEKACL